MSKIKENKNTGEWAKKTVNIQYGCEHFCRYCYARKMAARFKRIPTLGWDHPLLKTDMYKHLPRNTTVMLPSTHDITHDNIQYILTLIRILLDRKNKILLVTKPHMECITKIYALYKDQLLSGEIEFRFTIGSYHDETLKYWEPNAPLSSERRDCMTGLCKLGIRVSISMEPLLEANLVEMNEMIADFEYWDVKEIWIGAMQYLKNAPKLEYQTIYDQHKANPRIKFKSSFLKHLKGLL